MEPFAESLRIRPRVPSRSRRTRKYPGAGPDQGEYDVPTTDNLSTVGPLISRGGGIATLSNHKDSTVSLVNVGRIHRIGNC
jgi:hypothetical protein